MSESTKFPYWAYERTSRSIVRVVSVEGAIATLEDGTKAWLEALSQPDWLADAVQEMEDWKDEVDTQRGALDEPPLWDRPGAHGERGRGKLFKV